MRALVVRRVEREDPICWEPYIGILIVIAFIIVIVCIVNHSLGLRVAEGVIVDKDYQCAGGGIFAGHDWYMIKLQGKLRNGGSGSGWVSVSSSRFDSYALGEYVVVEDR